jgi:hypothetical protein
MVNWTELERGQSPPGGVHIRGALSLKIIDYKEIRHTAEFASSPGLASRHKISQIEPSGQAQSGETQSCLPDPSLIAHRRSQGTPAGYSLLAKIRG